MKPLPNTHSAKQIDLATCTEFLQSSNPVLRNKLQYIENRYREAYDCEIGKPMAYYISFKLYTLQYGIQYLEELLKEYTSTSEVEVINQAIEIHRTSITEIISKSFYN